MEGFNSGNLMSVRMSVGYIMCHILTFRMYCTSKPARSEQNLAFGHSLGGRLKTIGNPVFAIV